MRIKSSIRSALFATVLLVKSQEEERRLRRAHTLRGEKQTLENMYF